MEECRDSKINWGRDVGHQPMTPKEPILEAHVSRENSFMESLENWQQRRSTVEETRKLAAQIGERHFAPAIPVLVQLLNDPDPITRYNAAMSIGFDLKYRPATER